jgi:hypothetical protein
LSLKSNRLPHLQEVSRKAAKAQRKQENSNGEPKVVAYIYYLQEKPMSAALKLYEQLTEAPDDKTRARLIAEAFDALESRYPQLTDVATQGHMRESELRLQKEIKEVEGRLRVEIREVEGRLAKEMKQVEVNLMRAINAQARWMLGGLAVLGAVFKLADVLIG